MSNTSHRKTDPPDEDRPEGGPVRRFVRKAWKPVLGVIVLGVVAIGVAIGVAYAKLSIPDARAAAKAQATIYYYADGKTPLYKQGTNRESVQLDQVPGFMQHAVLAAEDRNFYHEPGISVRGIMRAVWSTATGQQVQGGSTITQEFARNYYNTLSQQRTVSRKVKEILISVKLGKKESKGWILDQYLNTIPWGRSAHGIQAASKTYFHRNVAHLNRSQAVYLAAIIQLPNYYPAHHAALKSRMNYVKQSMVQEGWLTQAQAAKIHVPHTYKYAPEQSKLHGEARYLYFAAENEAKHTLKHKGLGDHRLDQGGLKIVTTFNRHDVKAMGKAVKDVLGPGYRKQGIRAGVASVEPSTGAIRAIYGGHKTHVKVHGKRQLQYVNDAMGEGPQIGSSFKPYTLATALSQGIGLNSRISGHSPMCFHEGETKLGRCRPGDTDKVTNDSGEEPGDAITLTQATQQSINTAYVGLCLKVGGMQSIAPVEKAVGFPPKAVNRDEHNHCRATLGTISLAPLYQASGYATFANGGEHMQSHTIKTISTFGGQKLVDNTHERPKQAFSSDVAADATYAMQQVVKPGGTAGTVLGGFGRPIAGKTGTTDKNMSAWFVGFAPQLSTSVGLWRVEPHGPGKGVKRISLNGITAGGGGQIYGGTLPAKIWNEYMHHALENLPAKDFPPPAHVGSPHLWSKPTPSRSETPTPTRSHTSPTEHPTPTGPEPPTHSASPTTPVPPTTEPGPTGPTATTPSCGQVFCPPTATPPGRDDNPGEGDSADGGPAG